MCVSETPPGRGRKEFPRRATEHPRTADTRVGGVLRGGEDGDFSVSPREPPRERTRTAPGSARPVGVRLPRPSGFAPRAGLRRGLSTGSSAGVTAPSPTLVGS